MMNLTPENIISLDEQIRDGDSGSQALELTRAEHIPDMPSMSVEFELCANGNSFNIEVVVGATNSSGRRFVEAHIPYHPQFGLRQTVGVLNRCGELIVSGDSAWSRERLVLKVIQDHVLSLRTAVVRLPNLMGFGRIWSEPINYSLQEFPALGGLPSYTFRMNAPRRLCQQCRQPVRDSSELFCEHHTPAEGRFAARRTNATVTASNNVRLTFEDLDEDDGDVDVVETPSRPVFEPLLSELGTGLIR